MFQESRRGLLGLLAVALTGALFLSACGEKEVPDPYDVYGTLDQVTRGHVENEDFLFEIDAPEFVYVNGNMGLARSGNKLEVIVADNLEDRAPSWDGKLLGVQKFFSPYVWLMVKRVKDPVTLATTELDSVESAVLPRLDKSIQIADWNGFDIGTLRWNAQTSRIDDMFEAEVQTVGTIEYLPDHEAEQPAEDAEDAEPTMAYYLRAESSDALFKITNVTPEMELAFDLLEHDGLPFVGGVKIGAGYERTERRRSRVTAPVEIVFMKYANRYLKG